VRPARARRGDDVTLPFEEIHRAIERRPSLVLAPEELHRRRSIGVNRASVEQEVTYTQAERSTTGELGQPG